MNRERVRVVLDNRVSEDELTILAGRHQWRIRRRIEQSGDQPEEYVYTTRDGATDLHFIQDHKLGVNYILVKGPATPEIVPVLEETLEHYAPDDIREDAKRELSREERRRSLYRLALVTMDQGFDPEVFEIYKMALADTDPFVRGSALLGAAYLGWPQLADPIGALAGSDEPDDTIREDAALLFQRLVPGRA